MSNTQDTSTEAATTTPQFTPDALRNLRSMEDAVALLQGSGVTIAAAHDELGDGFALLDNKDALIGVPLLFVSWDFHPGDFGEDFVSARVVGTTDGGMVRYIVNDGGSGICQQLRDYTTRTGSKNGLFVKRGLRKSEYTNEHGAGITHYLNTSA